MSYCHLYYLSFLFLFFFFNDTATTEIYTLSLHDALPISSARPMRPHRHGPRGSRPPRSPLRPVGRRRRQTRCGDRKSTRLNSSHDQISYAVFCLKKKKKTKTTINSTQPSTKN